jgi:hypothetical protein
MSILTENYDQVVKKDIMNILDQSDIKEILEELELMNTTDNTSVDEDNVIV